MSDRRLTTVRRVREVQEEIARGELVRSNQMLQRASEAEARTWSRLDSWSLTGAVSTNELAAQWSVRHAGTLAARTQQRVTEHAAAGVIEARDAWTVAARRVEALERLDERLRAEASLELERKRNTELDDLVLARRVREQGAVTP